MKKKYHKIIGENIKKHYTKHKKAIKEHILLHTIRIGLIITIFTIGGQVGVGILETNSKVNFKDMETWWHITTGDAFSIFLASFLLSSFFMHFKEIKQFGIFKSESIFLFLATITTVGFLIGDHFGLQYIPQTVLNWGYDLTIFFGVFIAIKSIKMNFLTKIKDKKNDLVEELSKHFH